ncbi:MAG: DUF637 domain-containing protein, partial [Burkholderiales bacterium]|nr:DUF637 domain-containing protein [Burkholderiales bacterium]
LSGAEVNAAKGKVHLEAEGDIRLEASQEEFYSYARRIYNTGRWWNRKKTTEKITVNIANAAESGLNGQSILVKSGGSIDAYATAFNAPRGNIHLVAANALGMWAVQEKDFKNVDENTSRSFWKVQTGSSSSTDSRMVSSFLPSKLVAERIATDSGWDTRLHGTIFQSSLAGAVIQAGVGANARADAQIILQGIKTTIDASKTSKSNSVVWQEMVGKGSTVQTMALPTFTGPTAPVFSAPGGITAQIPDGELKTQVTQLANQPGMAYLQALSSRNDVNWQPVKLAYDQWQYKQEGLTPAGAALVAIAVAAASGGTGAAAGGNLLNSMVGAAFASLDALVAITLINNKGNIGQTLRDLGRSDTVKSMLTAALTAGALNTVGGLPSMEGLKRAGQFTDKLTMNLVNSSTSAAINTAINGGSLEDALKSASLSAVVSTAHGEIAGEIKGLEKHYLLHKLAHAAAGCAAGAAVGGACRDGAIGAAVGEMVVDPDLFPMPESEHDVDWVAYENRSKAYGKIVAGTVAAYTGGNAQTAINSAETAIENNRLAYRAVANQRGISVGQLYLNMRVQRLREGIVLNGGTVPGNATAPGQSVNYTSREMSHYASQLAQLNPLSPLVRANPSANFSQVPNGYINFTHGVNMNKLSGPTNAFGFTRNSRAYFKELLRTNPQNFDAANATLIARGDAPR